MANALEQLRYIDEQLVTFALTPDQAELVRVHRLMGLQLRGARLQGKTLLKRLVYQPHALRVTLQLHSQMYQTIGTYALADQIVCHSLDVS